MCSNRGRPVAINCDNYHNCTTRPKNFQDDETALHCAAERGHLECVQSLLDAGAPYDNQDRNGRTALHCALERGHVDVALALVTKGCRIDVQVRSADKWRQPGSKLILWLILREFPIEQAACMTYESSISSHSAILKETEKGLSYAKIFMTWRLGKNN